MDKFWILLIASAVSGLLIGLKYRVFVVGLLAPVIAAVAAIALREFGFVAAAAITFACAPVFRCDSPTASEER
jgi:hypothetical protein